MNVFRFKSSSPILLAVVLRYRDLIKLGLKPSEQFSTILDEIYELQLEGSIKDKSEALEIVRKRYL